MKHTFVRSRRGYVRSECVVPWRGYFVWVGGTLLALLCAADALIPKPPPSGIAADTHRPAIRIHSNAKGPEAVIIDTAGFVPPEHVRQPEQDMPTIASVGEHAPPASGELTIGGTAPGASPAAATRKAFAQLPARTAVKQARRPRSARSRQVDNVRVIARSQAAASPESRL